MALYIFVGSEFSICHIGAHGKLGTLGKHGTVSIFFFQMSDFFGVPSARAQRACAARMPSARAERLLSACSGKKPFESKHGFFVNPNMHHVSFTS